MTPRAPAAPLVLSAAPSLLCFLVLPRRSDSRIGGHSVKLHAERAKVALGLENAHGLLVLQGQRDFRARPSAACARSGAYVGARRQQ